MPPLWIDFVAGYAGGVCGVLVGHPFDTVKIRLQTRGHLYKSGTHAFKSIFKTEGIRGFFKGVLPPCIGKKTYSIFIF